MLEAETIKSNIIAALEGAADTNAKCLGWSILAQAGANIFFHLSKATSPPIPVSVIVFPTNSFNFSSD